MLVLLVLIEIAHLPPHLSLSVYWSCSRSTKIQAISHSLRIHDLGWIETKFNSNAHHTNDCCGISLLLDLARSESQPRSEWPERTSHISDCNLHFSHYLTDWSSAQHSALENALHFRNSFNSKGTAVHLSPGLSKRLMILTALVKKSIPGMETWKFCIEDKSTKRIGNKCCLITWNPILSSYFQIGLD